MTEQIDKADDGKLDVNEDQLQTEILEEDEQMDVISLDERLEELVIKDQARYDAEMKVFDKIRWATVHIAHATVSRFSCGIRLITADTVTAPCNTVRYYILSYRHGHYHQFCHPDSRLCSLLLRQRLG